MKFPLALLCLLLTAVPATAKENAITTDARDFECAVQTAYGEARNTSREEEAIVVNMLLLRAHMARLSICDASHRFFAPRPGKTADIIAAVKNVLLGDRSLVPLKFRHVTEMRSPDSDPPPEDKFICVGSASQPPANGLPGNLFFEKINRH